MIKIVSIAAALTLIAGQVHSQARVAPVEPSTPYIGDMKAIGEVKAMNGGRASWAVQDIAGKPQVSLYVADRDGIRSVVLYLDARQLEAMKTQIDAAMSYQQQRAAAAQAPKP